MDTQPSRITVSQQPSRSLSVAGVIDAHTAAELHAEIEALGGDGNVTLLMGSVEFIDSSGLRTIVASHHTLDEHGHKLVLREISEPVKRLIEITGLEDHLHIT